MRNYFKAGEKGNRKVFFFDDTSESSARGAFAKAAAHGGAVVLYAPLPWSGDWDACGLVGYRDLVAIKKDADRAYAELGAYRIEAADQLTVTRRDGTAEVTSEERSLLANVQKYEEELKERNLHRVSRRLHARSAA